MDSIWNKETPALPELPQLDSDITCEAVVIGGGMAGLLIAWKLQSCGIETVVLESATPGSGVTGGTTAKITAQHGLIYDRLIQSVGQEQARQYAQANQTAIEDFDTLIQQLQVACDFRRASAYVYDRKSDVALKKEVAAAKLLGIPAAFTRETELPFPVAGAVKFSNQATFQPLAFLSALIPRLKIYAHTTAKSITAQGVRTERGLVKAKNIIVATHFPFLQVPGLYFARMHQDRSYVLALEGPAPMKGMYIDASAMGYSFRAWRDLTLLGGGGHRAGKTPGEDGYKVLEQAARGWWPDAKVVGRWSAQDCMPMDGIPYIGAYPESGFQLYVATGFQKWGMTTSMVAARILAEQITHKKNSNAAVFSPHRLPSFPAISNLLKDGGVSASHLFSQAFYVPRAQLKDIAPGQGGVVLWHGKKVGVYHSEDGNYHLVPTKCPHLGCQLAWNAAEHTWDCPCHGSRFTVHGQRLDAPSTTSLSCHMLKPKGTPHSPQ